MERAVKTYFEQLEDARREAVVAALRLHGPSRHEAAKALGIQRTFLLALMRRFGLQDYARGRGGDWRSALTPGRGR